MQEDNDGKQERSLPLAARVDLVALAEITKYWTLEGYRIKTISQLVNKSISLLYEILLQNGMIKPSFDISKAKNFMNQMGLSQACSDKRSNKKLAAAVRFSMMRKEGLNPIQEDPTSYNILHNSHSIDHEKFKQERDARISSYTKAGFTTESSIEEVQQRDAQQDSELDELINQRKGE